MLYKVARSIVYVIFSILFRVRIIGKENIPKSGACIISFNHTSLCDPPFAAVFIPRQLNFMAKEELFHIPVLRTFIKAFGAFPVKRSVGDISAIKTALNILKEEKVLAIFPEGARVKKGQTAYAKPGVALIATKAKVPVIPVGISGEYRLFHKITIHIGNPITFEEYYDRKLKMEELQNISNIILDKIKQLTEVH
mgnify:FL=1